MPLEMLCRRQKLPQRCDVECLHTEQRERQSQQRRPANSTGQGMQGAFFYTQSRFNPFLYQLECNLQRIFPLDQIRIAFIVLQDKAKTKLIPLCLKMTFSPFGTQQLFGIQKHQIAIQVVIEKTFFASLLTKPVASVGIRVE